MSRYDLSVVCQSADRDVARPAGFEPAAFGSGGQRSIQLSYGRFRSLTSLAHSRSNVKGQMSMVFGVHF